MFFFFTRSAVVARVLAQRDPKESRNSSSCLMRCRSLLAQARSPRAASMRLGRESRSRCLDPAQSLSGSVLLLGRSKAKSTSEMRMAKRNEGRRRWLSRLQGKEI